MNKLKLFRVFSAWTLRCCLVAGSITVPSKLFCQGTIIDSLAIIKNTIIYTHQQSGSWGMRELSNITQINDSIVLGLFSKKNLPNNLYSFKKGENPHWELELSDWGRYGETVEGAFKAAGSIFILTFTKDSFFILEIVNIRKKCSLNEIASYPLHALQWRHQVTFDTNNSTWMLHLGYYDKNAHFVDSVKVIRIKDHDVKTIYTYKTPIGDFPEPFAAAINKDQIIFTFNSDTLFVLFDDSLHLIPISVGAIYYITHFDSIDKKRVFAFILHNTFNFSKTFTLDDNTKNIQYTDHLSTRDISDPGTIDPYNNHWYIKANGDSSNIYKFSDTFAKSTLKTMIFKQKKLIELPHFVNNYLIINSLYGDTFISSAINPIGKSFDSLILDGPIGKIIPCECGHLVITRKHSNQIFGISYLPKSLFLIDSSGVRTKILDLSNCPILVLDNFPRIYSQLNAFVYFNLGEFGNFHYASLGLDSICKSNTSNNSSGYIIYPNPSSERLYSNKDVSKLNVFNSVGQKMSIHIKIDDSNRKYLDLVNYSKGIYFVGFENTYIKYFILQN